jgi:hypothetical protein
MIQTFLLIANIVALGSVMFHGICRLSKLSLNNTPAYRYGYVVLTCGAFYLADDLLMGFSSVSVGTLLFGFGVAAVLVSGALFNKRNYARRFDLGRISTRKASG